jgi:hypothetical protein
LVVGDQIYIAKDGLHPGLRNRLLRLAAFQNPEFYKAQAMRLSTYGNPRVIACAEDHPHHIGLPRGCLEEVRDTLTALGVRVAIRDERWAGRPLAVTFRGELRPDQRVAAHAMLKYETGVLAATTAFGKTVVAAWLIAQRAVNTLVLVHRRQLLDQWIERLSTFLDVPAKSIGRIGGGRSRPTGMLDVAVMQSLVKKGVVGKSGHAPACANALGRGISETPRIKHEAALRERPQRAHGSQLLVGRQATSDASANDGPRRLRRPSYARDGSADAGKAPSRFVFHRFPLPGLLVARNAESRRRQSLITCTGVVRVFFWNTARMATASTAT